MPQQNGLTSSETMPRPIGVHILGAGPVGLLMTALLQSNERFSVHLYEKRREYTCTRMVQLASFVVADSVATYCSDYVDEESVEVIFDPSEIDAGLAFRRSIPSDLMALLHEWHWLRGNFPHVAESMDRFIDKIKQETNGEIVGDLEIIRIPLDLYRARNATSREYTRATGEVAHLLSCTSIERKRRGAPLRSQRYRSFSSSSSHRTHAWRQRDLAR
jgi:hypothetical protein